MVTKWWLSIATRKMSANWRPRARSAAASLEDAASQLEAPRIFWLMLPAGAPTEETVAALLTIAQAGDVVIDGGNSFFKDDVRRFGECRERGIHYVDVGTSGGVWGLERGYCLMIGGEKQIVDMLDPIFDTLAPGYGTLARTAGRDAADDRAERGYIHAGPAGAGHFVKMVHNGIEYGLMQAYAEGFDVLKGRASEKLPEDERFDLNLPDIAEVWRRGSVISSWLLDLCASGLARDRGLDQFSGHVADSGEGQWTIDAAMEEAIPANVLAAALVRAVPQPDRTELRRQIIVRHAVRLRRPRRGSAVESFVPTDAVAFGQSNRR